ncbi:MAG: hypothetical protein CVV16_07820 [Gammaproteobacteria bacterium HGW-Gammaproteobacteria-6]|nr:MAG: hypothetical protein CVV16_07820 [Gammaproteobacteria bacterium HGW-Gammaproteobacteria-6]
MRHQHIRIVREEAINERRPKKPPLRPAPSDPSGYGRRLKRSFDAAIETDVAIPGFDDRRLLKLEVVAGFRPDDFTAIPGVEVLSQEGSTVVLIFADARGVREFEQRLTMLARDGKVTRKDIFFALQAFDHWTPEDRTGRALADAELPDAGAFLVDVELWPLPKPGDRQAMVAAFEAWLAQAAIASLDKLDKASLLMFRLRVDAQQLSNLLNHRDVRQVDLPPDYGLEMELVNFDVNQLPAVESPTDDAALIGVLDSGVAGGHPLLRAALGEAEGFVLPDRESADQQGHGSRVAGLALYGDVRACLQRNEFVPQLRLLSGRVFNNDGRDDTRFVEKNVEDAVRYFHGEYGCRVFCFSYGDRNKIYDGRHLRGLAYVLDSLSRELGVLFVVPTGNLCSDDLPADPVASYPGYLLEDNARLLDPAPALNVLTVGGLAEFEADAAAQRYPDTIEGQSIAKSCEPAPFTRCGPSVNGAIKPDLVEYAGNQAVSRNGAIVSRRLGVLSLSKDFASGHPLNEDVGTSFAAPRVAHVAARVLNHEPQASSNLLRAMLAAHARWPERAIALMTESGKLDMDSLLKLCGYGRVRDDAVYESLDNAVTLFAEDTLQDNHHHFYELPLPPDLWTPGKRTREITVSLAHSPDVRTTRIDYRATKLSFQLVSKPSLQTVSAWFRKKRDEGAAKADEYSRGRGVTLTQRSRGTLQTATWRFPSARSADDFKLFLVVTRHDANWSEVKATPEPYALAFTIQDRENLKAKLYQQIQLQLQLREQVRIRARARITR